MTTTEDPLAQEASGWLSGARGTPLHRRQAPPDLQHAKEIEISMHVIANMHRKPPFLDMSRSGASNLALNAVSQPAQPLQPQGAA